VSAGLLARADLDAVVRSKEPGQKLGQALAARGLVTEQQVTQALSQVLSVPWVSLYHVDFSPQLLARIPREFAEKYALVPIFVRNVRGQGETLYVATDDPTNEAALAEVSRLAGLPTRPMIASTSDIQATIRTHYGAAPPAASAAGARVERAPDPLGDLKATRRDVPHRPPPQSAVQAPPPAPPAPPPPSPAPPAPPPAPAAPAEPQAPAAPRAPASAPEAPESGPDSLRGVRRRTSSSLTLLDGTTVLVPSAKGGEEGKITARDIVSALRARTHGADAPEILGENPRWEAYVAALLSLLLRKGLVSERELLDELSRV